VAPIAVASRAWPTGAGRLGCLVAPVSVGGWPSGKTRFAAARSAPGAGPDHLPKRSAREPTFYPLPTIVVPAAPGPAPVEVGPPPRLGCPLWAQPFQPPGANLYVPSTSIPLCNI